MSHSPKEVADALTVVRAQTERWISVEGGCGYWRRTFAAWTEHAGEVVHASTVYCQRPRTTKLGQDRIAGIFARLEVRVRGAVELGLYRQQHI